MKQGSRFVPLVWSKLPCLACRHHTHDPLPRVRSEFLECVSAVDDEIPLDCPGPGTMGGRGRGGRGVGREGKGGGRGGGWVTPSIDVEKVFGQRVSSCRCAFARGGRRFEAGMR